jgi:hypothetical protein
MKKIILLLALTPVALFAQNQTTPSGSGSIYRNPSRNTSLTNDSSSAAANANLTTTSPSSGSSGVILTNKQGQTFTVEDLATELRTLRTTVDQTMPMLSAFNEIYSNSANADKSLTGKLSGVLSGALNRNQNTNNAADTNSSKYANVVKELEGLLSKNNGASTPISADTIRELGTLQSQLQPVASTLQTLKVDTGSSVTNNASALTPTGRTSGNGSTP